MGRNPGRAEKTLFARREDHCTAERTLHHGGSARVDFRGSASRRRPDGRKRYVRSLRTNRFTLALSAYSDIALSLKLINSALLRGHFCDASETSEQSFGVCAGEQKAGADKEEVSAVIAAGNSLAHARIERSGRHGEYVQVAEESKGTPAGEEEAVALLKLMRLAFALHRDPAAALRDGVELDATVSGILQGPCSSRVQSGGDIGLRLQQGQYVG